MDSNGEVKRNMVFTGVALIEVKNINWQKISSWVHLRHVAAWVLRFVELLRGEEERRMDVTLSAEEVNAAEVVVLKDVQRTAFPEELLAIQEKRRIKCQPTIRIVCIH